MMQSPFCHLLAFSLVATTTWTNPQQQSTETAIPKIVAQEFAVRVATYMEVRRAATSELAAPTEKMQPQAVVQRRTSMKDNIRSARTAATPGAIFSPQIVEAMAAVFRSDPFAITGRDATAMARETTRPPDSVPIPKVNSEYPPDDGLVSPPATILLKLPELPKELEYRLVGPHLILRDIETNLVVDVAPNLLRQR